MDYFNNKIICDLVEAPHSGILAQLDEACFMVGKVDDKLFLDAMSTKLASHKHFTSRKVSTLIIFPADWICGMKIIHVTYEC